MGYLGGFGVVLRSSCFLCFIGLLLLLLSNPFFLVHGQDFKANAVESANLRASWFVLYLLSTSCVLTLAYSTLFLLVLLGDTLLLLNPC